MEQIATVGLIWALTSILGSQGCLFAGSELLPSCCAKTTLEAGPATETPAMSMLAVSAIAGVTFFADELHQRLAAQRIRQRPSLRLVQPHKGCVNDETRLHSKVQGKLHRFNCVISTIRGSRNDPSRTRRSRGVLRRSDKL